MLDLSKAKLPDTVEVDGNFYAIHTDFRFWINFSRLIKNQNCTLGEFDFIYCDEKPFDRKKGFVALMEFYSPKKELPRALGNQTNKTLLDYDIDSELIYSSFYQQYKIDLFDEKLRLHWHKFLALMDGIRETKLTDVIGYRSYVKSSKKYEQTMAELQHSWEITTEMTLTDEEKKAIEDFDKLLK